MGYIYIVAERERERVFPQERRKGVNPMRVEVAFVATLRAMYFSFVLLVPPPLFFSILFYYYFASLSADGRIYLFFYFPSILSLVFFNRA